MYRNIQYRQRHKWKEEPAFTLEEFRSWILNQPNYTDLYEDWVFSDFQKDLAPSVNRKIDTVGYILSNMEILTWRENWELGNEAVIAGTARTSNHRRVQNVDTGEIFISTAAAAKSVGRNQATLRMEIDTDIRCGGYLWTYNIEEID